MVVKGFWEINHQMLEVSARPASLTVSVGHVGRRLRPAPAVGPPLVAGCFGDAAAGRAGGRGSDLRTAALRSGRFHCHRRRLLFFFVSVLL